MAINQQMYSNILIFFWCFFVFFLGGGGGGGEEGVLLTLYGVLILQQTFINMMLLGS